MKFAFETLDSHFMWLRVFSVQHWGIYKNDNLKKLKYTVGAAGFHGKITDSLPQELFDRLLLDNYASLKMNCLLRSNRCPAGTCYCAA